MKTKAKRSYIRQKDDEEIEFDEEVKKMKKKKKKTSSESSASKDKEEGAEEFVEKSTLSIDDIIKAVTVDGNLQPVTEFYDEYSDTNKNILEDATVRYLNIYNKAFIEIISLIPI